MWGRARYGSRGCVSESGEYLSARRLWKISGCVEPACTESLVVPQASGFFGAAVGYQVAGIWGPTTREHQSSPWGPVGNELVIPDGLKHVKNVMPRHSKGAPGGAGESQTL